MGRTTIPIPARKTTSRAQRKPTGPSLKTDGFEVVPDDILDTIEVKRRPISPLMATLLTGKKVRTDRDPDSIGGSLRVTARAHGFKLRSRSAGDGTTILWLEALDAK